MADSVVEIFNGDITNAQMVSGYDIITTDANTTYVIKDTQSTGGFYDSVPATINNTLIGNFSRSLTGSEIMGVSSTLNVTADEYSYNNFHLNIYDQLTDQYQSVKKGYVNNLPALTEETNTSANLANNVTFSTSTYAPTLKFGNSYYQFYHDGNSSTQVYYWSTASSSRVELQSTGYRPMAYSIKNQEVYYVKSDQGLYKHSPTGGESLIRSSLGTMSSYCRGAYSNGWFFYINNSGETTKVFCINLTNGRKVTFGSLGSAEISNYFQLAVSYDETTDKFFMYRRDSNWNVTNFYMRQAIPSVTKTQMDALSVDATYNDSTETSRNTSTLENLFTSSYSGTTFGADLFHGSSVNGNELYYLEASTGANKIKAILFDYNAMTTTTVYESSFTYGASLSSSGAFEQYVPDASEILSAQYDPSPNLRLRLTGVKTTTT